MNLNHIGLILCLSISLLLPSISEAKVTQSIDRDEISAGETFVLDIQIDEDTNAQPDLSLIPGDFTIVSSSQYQHTQIINSRRSSIKGWKIKLKTLKTGEVIIPAITVGNESTRPIQLTIRDSSDELELNGERKAIFLEAKIDSDDAYVQQQIIFNISLYRSVNTHYASLSEPTAANSIVEKLGDDVQFEKMIGGKRYVVTQRKYAIFPQQSGKLEISPVTFTADVNDNSRQRSLFLNSTRPVSISTKPVAVNVKPKPASASTPWLPAKNVILADSWTPNTTELKVGEPITWTLLLTVEGLSESQLPDIEIPPVNGLQIYPDTPKKEREVNRKGIVGKRVEKFAVIPSAEGEVTIPEIKVKWWDVNSDSEKVATLKPKRFIVGKGSANASPQIISPIPEVTQQQKIQQQQPTSEPSAEMLKALDNWKYATFGIFALWILTLIAYFAKPKYRQSTTGTAKDKNHEISEAQKSTLTQLKKAVSNQDLKALESHLLNLAKQKGHRIGSLGALSSRLSDPQLVSKIDALEASLYSAKQQSNSVELTQADIDAIFQQIKSEWKNEGSQAIPPLYPR